MKTLDWFRVDGRAQFLIGEPLNITGTGEGFDRAVDHALGALARPHERAQRDLLTSECNELADALVAIAAEDGDSRSLGNVLRTLVFEVARRTPNDPIIGGSE